MRVLCCAVTMALAVGTGGPRLACGEEGAASDSWDYLAGPAGVRSQAYAPPACRTCSRPPSARRQRQAEKQAAKQAEAYFNCGCSGSYKFPVPPQYTYHWPGMYAAQRMTDHASPWRNPSLRPFSK